jgi:hypothetical protein
MSTTTRTQDKLIRIAALLRFLADEDVLHIVHTLAASKSLTQQELEKLYHDKFSPVSARHILDTDMYLFKDYGIIRQQDNAYSLNPQMPPLARVVILHLWPEFAEQLPEPERVA